MTVYGQIKYGSSTYGYTSPVQFTVDPFIVQPVDYSSIQVTWKQPQGSVYGWRLVKNMSGIPATPDDGLIVLQDGIPGGRTVLNTNPYFDNSSSAGWTGFNGTMTLVSGSNLPSGAVYPYALKIVGSGAGSVAIEEASPYHNANINTSYLVSAWVYSSVSSISIGFDWRNSGTFVSTTTTNFDVPINTWTQVYSFITSPSSGINQAAVRVGSGVTTATIYAQAILATTSGAIPVTSTSYIDASITPGKYHYYGLWLKTASGTDTWVLAGSSGCLMPADYDSADQMLDLIPSFYIQLADNQNELQSDPTGNLFLEAFIGVFGWGFDYLRTQYDTYLNLNDPHAIPVKDLYNLASQLNVPIYPRLGNTVLRKAVFNNAIVNILRGTVTGIQSQVSAYTGWEIDVTVGVNLMLSDDQSWFAHPIYNNWSANITYNVGEKVTYSNGTNTFFYNCIATGNLGNAPTGTSSSNTWWAAIQNTTDTTTLANSNTGFISTWEPIYTATPNATPSAGTIAEVDGIVDPINANNHSVNGLLLTNTSGATANLEVRTASRRSSEIAWLSHPNPQTIAGDGIPVPQYWLAPQWNATTIYEPGSIVMYNNMPFIAIRSSVGSTPSFVVLTSASDWEPAGFDVRGRITSSAYIESTSTIQPQPFMEFYDSSGNYITTVLARNVTGGGATGVFDNVVMDSFVAGPLGAMSASRTTDDCAHTWTTATGGYSLSAFGGGCLYPTAQATRTIATATAVTNTSCQVGLTFITNPPSGFVTALALRYTATNSYLRADMTTLKQNNAGTITTLGTYSTPFVPGDRMLAQLNGSTITILRNGVSVLSVTSAFNSSSTTHGIIYETQ